eukprot:scaffold3043_cov121-Cylindrotheca_fusiformis.AAC.4
MSVEEGFRHVDRRIFVPRMVRDMSYADQPLKEGNVHLSAPHIYGTVLEALELPPNTSMSFLNAGSGSGYLTCLAAAILGPRSSHYCVEIQEDVVEHSKEAIAKWKANYPPAQAICHMDIIHGNALEIDADRGESVLGFDRIYIGASIGRHELPQFRNLLKPGGILVGPVEDELVKVVRNQTPHDRPSDNDYSHHVVSGVRFAPFVSAPSIETVIPARIWSPSIHKYFPDSFRSSCKEVMLCSHAKYEQPIKEEPRQKVNAASMLPRALWMEILSFTHRDWFKEPESEVEILRRRLKEEQANAEKANLARLQAETRCHLAERERDVYQLLARRWKNRLSAQLGEDVNDNIEEAAAAMLLGGAENMSIFGLFRRFHEMDQDHDDEDDSDYEDDSNEEDNMEEDSSESNYVMIDDEDDVVRSQVSSSPSAVMIRPQVRTVSVSEQDVRT